ncbi:hypothetical protein J3F83DRAFT_736843 [Trichoderma novae-zelandiae]
MPHGCSGALPTVLCDTLSLSLGLSKQLHAMQGSETETHKLRYSSESKYMPIRAIVLPATQLSHVSKRLVKSLNHKLQSPRVRCHRPPQIALNHPLTPSVRDILLLPSHKMNICPNSQHKRESPPPCFSSRDTLRRINLVEHKHRPLTISLRGCLLLRFLLHSSRLYRFLPLYPEQDLSSSFYDSNHIHRQTRSTARKQLTSTNKSIRREPDSSQTTYQNKTPQTPKNIPYLTTYLTYTNTNI